MAQSFLPCVSEDHQSWSPKSHYSTACTCASYSAHKHQGEGLVPTYTRHHQEIPCPPYEATRCAALRALKGDASETPELFLLWVIPLSSSFLSFFAGKLGLWCTDFPCLQFLIFSCCGFLGAFLNCELVDSSRLEQGSQYKCSPLNVDRQSSAGLHVEPELQRIAEARSSCWCYHNRMLTAHLHVKTSHLKFSANHTNSCFSGLVDADTAEWDIQVPVPFSFLQTPFNIHLIMFTVFLFNPMMISSSSVRGMLDFLSERYVNTQLGRCSLTSLRAKHPPNNVDARAPQGQAISFSSGFILDTLIWYPAEGRSLFYLY